MVYVYKYCVEYWDECDKNTNTERGIVFGATFSEVIHSLENYYGKENIVSIRELKWFDIGDKYVMPECAFEEIGYKLCEKSSD